LLAVQYLSTRVSKCTVEDVEKLRRVLEFLKSTRHKSRMIDSSAFTKIVGMIDAAFSVYADGYGHSGMIVFAGNSAMTARSVKQGCSSKDSTEAEIIALSDMMLKVIWHNDWWTGQGKEMEIPTIYQDNTSVISIVENNKNDKLRTKHLRARTGVIREAVVNKDFKLSYCPTKNMVADMLTKPLPASVFYKFAFAIMGDEVPPHLRYDFGDRSALMRGKKNC